MLSQLNRPIRRADAGNSNDKSLDWHGCWLHNAAGVTLVASMRQRKLRSLAGRWRFGGILLALSALVWFDLFPGSAQTNTPRRVTSVRAADAPEGSRVTVVSNSALNDYEAYRRGDRFYVKVPGAGMAAVQPQLRGNGFEDVEVQEAGADVIFSFRLKPGTAARVNQSRNRLDVIFSTSAHKQNAPTTTQDSNASAAPRRQSDTSEPLSPTATSQSARDPRSASNTREGNSGTKTNASASTTHSTDTGLPSGTTGQNLGAPPAGSSSTNPNPPATGTTTTASTQTVVNRKTLFAGWSLINWLAIAVGLVVLGLSVFLVFRRRTRAETSRHPRDVREAVSLAPPLGSLSHSQTKDIEQLSNALATSNSSTKRSIAAVKLGQTHDHRATKHLVAALSDSAPEVRRAAVESLRQLADPSAIPALRELLSRESDRQLPALMIQEAIAASAAPETETQTLEETPSGVELPAAPTTKERFLGIQASEQEAFREFLDERVSKQAQGIETPTPRVAARNEAGDSSQLPADEDFVTEAARLLLQERTLRSAAEALEAKYLEAAKARREFDENARLQAEGRIRDAHVSSRIGLDSDAVPSLEEENRYRSEAETLRKAAGELARKRQAVLITNSLLARRWER